MKTAIAFTTLALLVATLVRRAFRDVHFDYDMEVEKCGMTA
ncbi:hypothetical protein [Thiobacillus sp.]|nr:hypothetical protein [Thiobacillus sp.]